MSQAETAPSSGGFQIVASAFGWVFGLLWLTLGLVLAFGPDSEVRWGGVAFIPLAIMILPPVTRKLRAIIPPLRPPGVPTLAFFVLTVAALVANVPTDGPSETNASEPPAKQAGNTEPSTRPASVDIVSKGDVLRPAQDALNAGEVDRAIELFFARPVTSKRRVQADAKRLLAAIQEASDRQIGRDPAAEFVDRVQDHWLPQIEAIPTTGPVTEDQIRTARVFLEEVAARELKSSQELPQTAELKRAQDQLATAIRTKQLAVFPRWRRFYGKQLGQRLWERNVSVDVSGTGGRTIRFTGGLFASNANIATFQQGAEDGLKRLRFSRAAYRWMSQADGWSYRMDVPDDGDLGFWTGSQFENVP